VSDTVIAGGPVAVSADSITTSMEFAGGVNAGSLILLPDRLAPALATGVEASCVIVHVDARAVFAVAADTTSNPITASMAARIAAVNRHRV
jgi:hypothetical protein